LYGFTGLEDLLQNGFGKAESVFKDEATAKLSNLSKKVLKSYR
jgi:hypothetical protein